MQVSKYSNKFKKGLNKNSPYRGVIANFYL